jgi:hypothetical protein
VRYRAIGTAVGDRWNPWVLKQAIVQNVNLH